MYSLTPLQKIFSALFIASALSACGSSGSASTELVPPSNSSGSGNTSNDTVTNTLPNLISGKVQSVASKTINISGRALDVSAATITYAGQNIDLETVVSGMPIQVVTNGDKVLSVELNPRIAGTVTAITGEFVEINGLSLRLDDDLVNQVRVGDYVLADYEVEADGTKEIESWLILNAGERPLSVEVEGNVTQLDTVNQTFVINNILVDYSATPSWGFTLQNGLWLEVFGEQQGELENLRLLAATIELDDFADGLSTEINGRITWVDNTKTRFELNQRYSFTIDAGTRFNDGTQQDLSIGRMVEVEGMLIDNVFQVKEVEFDSVFVTPTLPTVTPVPGQQRSFELTGRVAVENQIITFNNVAFTVNAQSRFEDALQLSNIDGQLVEIEGIERDGLYIVKEIELAQVEPTIDLEGLVQDGMIWGYKTADDSLLSHNGTWVAVECNIAGDILDTCVLDLD